MEEHEARERLVRGLLDALDAHATSEREREAVPVPAAGNARSSRRRTVVPTRPRWVDNPTTGFMAVLEEGLPDWRELVAASATNYPLGTQRLAGQ